MTEHRDHSGMAALSICEALLLAMNDRNLLPESEIMGVLHDAAITHENAAALPETPHGERDRHAGAARLINHIISSGNSVRRP
ncbi:MAG: hypothetical protein ACK4YU_06485 [Paracoccus sp. (in: a-proteobacteria)]